MGNEGDLHGEVEQVESGLLFDIERFKQRIQELEESSGPHSGVEKKGVFLMW